MRRARKTQPLAQVASKVLGRADDGGKRHRAAAVNAWGVVAGDAITAHTKGFAMRDDGELVVFVDGAAWANQLTLMSCDLVERLNDHLGQKAVTSLRFTVSRKAKEGMMVASTEDTQAERKAALPEPAALDEVEMAQLSRVASVVKVDALRDAALRAMTRDLEQKKGARLHAAKSRRRSRPEQGRKEGS